MALPSLTHGPGDFSPFVNIGAIAASDAQQRSLAQQGIKSRETPAVMQIKQLFFLKKISTSLENIEGILGKGLLLEQRNNSTQELTDIEARREAGDKKGGIAFEKIAGGVAKLGLKALAGSFLLGVFGGLMKWGERLKPILNSVLNGLDWIDTKFKNLGIIVEELTDSKRLGALVAMIPLVVAALAPLAMFKLPRMLMGAAIKGGYKATKAVAKGGYKAAKGAARMGARPRATARLARMKVGRAGRVIGRGFGMAARAGGAVATALPKLGAAAAGVGGIASKIFPITMIAGAIFGTIKGVVDGFKQDGIMGAIKGGFKGLIDWTVGGIIDLIADGLGWVMKKMGFEELGEKIQEFSFSDMIIGLLDKGIEALKEAIWGIIQKLPDWAQKGLPEGLKAAVKPKSAKREEYAKSDDAKADEVIFAKDTERLKRIAAVAKTRALTPEEEAERKGATARINRAIARRTAAGYDAPKVRAPTKKAAPEKSSSGWSLPGAERRAANDAALQQRVAARNAGVPATVQSSGGNSMQNAGASMQSAAAGVTYGTESSGDQPSPPGPNAVSSFDQVIGRVLKHEGGYVNDPQDPGGETKFGISKRAYPNVDIKGLTIDAAKAIYRRDYWDAVGADNLPPAIRYMAFDTAVNMGVGAAKKMIAQAGGDLAKFTQLRRDRYAAIIRKRPSSAKYAKGWERRLQEVASASTGGGGVGGAPSKGSTGSVSAVASKPTPVAPPSASSGPAIAAASAASTPAALAATTSGGNTTNINAPSTTIASNGPDKAPSSNGAMNAVTPPEFAPMVS